MRASGLERVAERFGVRLKNALVLETEPSLRLPRGAGEVFAATPVPHAATRGLVREGGKVDFPVIVSESRPLELASGGPAQALLKSSAEAVALEDLALVLDGKGTPPDAARAERVLAAASELEKPKGSSEKHGQRAVVFGSRSLPWTRSFRDPALLGDRLLVENALAWVAARPAIVSVPEKPARSVGLVAHRGVARRNPSLRPRVHAGHGRARGLRAPLPQAGARNAHPTRERRRRGVKLSGQQGLSLALVALALASVAARALHEKRPGTSERLDRSRNLVAVFREDEVRSVEVRSKAGTFRLERAEAGEQRTPGSDAGPTWLLLPEREVADPAAADRLISGIGFAVPVRRLESGDLEALGLAKPEITLAIAMGDTKLTLSLGKAAPAPAGAAYVSVARDRRPCRARGRLEGRGGAFSHDARRLPGARFRRSRQSRRARARARTRKRKAPARPRRRGLSPRR